MILSPNKYKDLPVTNRQGSAAHQTALTPRKAETVTAQAGRWLLASLVAMAILFGSSTARAQQITGAITGKLTDEQGALVTNANIKATNVATGFTRTTKTDNAGGYNIQYLPVGGYTVTVDAPGFKKFVQQNLVIAVDQTQPLNVTLSVGAESQTDRSDHGSACDQHRYL